MRTLTKETKQVLSNILLVKGELKTQDHLLAVLAQIALTYNHDLTAKDYADLNGVPLAEYDDQVRRGIEAATMGYERDEKNDRTLRLGETVLTTYEKYGNGGQAILICPLINNAIEEYQKLKKHGYKAEIINSELRVR
ncbi:hypothetical protein [Aggregatibacter actinomycetemcomitans]|uniref:hypothetical protein n=1 Tax=Aggregatibacter actinomycetemcomitans TaxID=714 RepID=UPI0011D4D410|nr:hypothetical protein [Aggregatibacter actinomycetemcomitans]TYA86971.1 hypothetical protein FXE09_10490 [Aggregatibacter actinomycetemcomitans]